VRVPAVCSQAYHYGITRRPSPSRALCEAWRSKRLTPLSSFLLEHVICVIPSGKFDLSPYWNHGNDTNHVSFTAWVNVAVVVASIAGACCIG
jgi:hypothetical protein